MKKITLVRAADVSIKPPPRDERGRDMFHCGSVNGWLKFEDAVKRGFISADYYRRP